MNLASKLNSIIKRLKHPSNFEKLTIIFIIFLGFMYKSADLVHLTEPLNRFPAIFFLATLLVTGIANFAILFGIFRKMIYGIFFTVTKAIKDAKSGEKSDSKSIGLFNSIVIDLIILCMSVMIFCVAISIFSKHCELKQLHILID